MANGCSSKVATSKASSTAPARNVLPDPIPAPDLLKKLPSYFSNGQLSLALAITKSVPRDTSIKDYLHSLRKHVKLSAQIPRDTQRSIDTAEFWKEQCNRFYQERKTLEAKVNRLEEELSKAKEPNQLNDNRSLTTMTLRKRGAESSDIEDWLEQQDVALPDQDTVLLLCSFVLRISRQRRNLQETTKKSTLPTHMEHLSKICVTTILLLETAISDCLPLLSSLKCNDDPRLVAFLQQLVYQTSLTFHACFASLNELCGTIVGRTHRFAVISRMVLFFHSCLERLRAACERQDIQPRRKRPRTSNEHEHAVTKYLSRMLIHMSQLKWQDDEPGHSDILEGILFSILEHTGRLISHAVFDEHVETSTKPGHITMNSEVEESEKTDPSSRRETQNLEARYILPILRAALGSTAEAQKLVTRVLAENTTFRVPGTGFGALAGRAGGSNEMLQMARKRIQESLLKSTVGGEEFLSLRMPTPPVGDDDEVVVGDGQEDGDWDGGGTGGRDWFVASVWSLVGWEMVV